MSYLLFGWGIFLILAIIIPIINYHIFQNISIQTFAISYKPSSFVMADTYLVKHIPSTFHDPPAKLLQIREFYEVIFIFVFKFSDF